MARCYNPAWWFANGFYRLFLRVTLGASRLQEALADRHAMLAWVVQDFMVGLNHKVRQLLTFEVQATQEINQAVKQIQPIHNL